MEYVLDTLHSNTTKVRNIRAYLLTTLYNAPSTCRLSSKIEHFFRKLTDRIEHSNLSVISIFYV